jgi:hypothetical protein
MYAFYELKEAGKPWSTERELQTFCEAGSTPACDQSCDGGQNTCSAAAGEWCAEQDVTSGSNQTCTLVRWNEAEKRAVASNDVGLPPINLGAGGWTYYSLIVYNGGDGPGP